MLRQAIIIVILSFFFGYPQILAQTIEYKAENAEAIPEIESDREFLGLRSECSGNPTCLEDFFYDQIREVVQKEKGLFFDSTIVLMSFRVDPLGNPKDRKIFVYQQTRRDGDSLEARIALKLDSLPPFEVKNFKGGNYPAWHNFRYEMVRITELIWERLPIDVSYKGGRIIHPPRFKDCLASSYADDMACFNRKMRDHIIANFKYPKEALEAGIEGQNMVSFSIGPDGRVTDITPNASFRLFVDEGIRIVSKLPRFTPGTRNDEPDSFNFTIPIIFRLSE